MNWQQSWKQSLAWGGTVCLAFVLCGWHSLHAQSIGKRHDTVSVLRKPRFKWPKPPKDPGAPQGRRRGGAQRDACFADHDGPDDATAHLTVTALVPHNQSHPGVWAFTAATHPTFWFHLEPAGIHMVPMTFVLQDAQDEELYRTQVRVTATEAGILNIPVPSTVTPLQVNQRYTWTFWFNCNHNYVRGNIYRIVGEYPPIASTQPTRLTQVSQYVDRGIWHDALTDLATHRQQEPDNARYRQVWQELLEQVGLNSIAPMPLLPCCHANTEGLETMLEPVTD